MSRFRFRLDRMLAVLVAVLTVAGNDPAAPISPDCRGGVLYGTVWGVTPGSMSGAGTTVYAVSTDRASILGSDRADDAGRYRICGLPLRTRFDLVAVPPDPSSGVAIETVTLTLSGGQQRNIYPGRSLQRLPDLIARRGLVHGSIDRSPVIRAPAVDSPRVVTTPAIQSAPSTDFLGNRVDAPDGSLRVVSGDGLLLYFSGEEPRYMQLRVPGTDGRGCYFEFDWGIDEQQVEAIAGGYLLQSPAWGQIGMRRDGEDRVSLDLSGVYTPVCRVRSASGGPITWQRTPDGWVRSTR